MGHMIVETYQGDAYSFLDLCDTDRAILPADMFRSLTTIIDFEPGSVRKLHGVILCRLSAPGYLDCSDWQHMDECETLHEATREYAVEMGYCVDCLAELAYNVFYQCENCEGAN